jgi:hypothetical protein
MPDSTLNRRSVALLRGEPNGFSYPHKTAESPSNAWRASSITTQRGLRSKSRAKTKHCCSSSVSSLHALEDDAHQRMISLFRDAIERRG